MSRDSHIFQKPRSHLKILDARGLTWKKLDTQNPQILGTAEKYLGATASWRHYFRPRVYKFSINQGNTSKFKVSLKGREPSSIKRAQNIKNHKKKKLCTRATFCPGFLHPCLWHWYILLMTNQIEDLIHVWWSRIKMQELI